MINILINKILLLLLCFSFSINATEIGDKLMKHYFAVISKVDSNYVYFKDGTKLLINDNKKKTFDEMLNNPDIKDMFHYKYTKGKPISNPEFNEDPGRIRCYKFAAKLYGKTKTEIKKNLVAVR
jgi:hypothetical protein